MSRSLADAVRVLRDEPSVILVGHVHPDGDCLGSVLSLGLALEQLGKQVCWVADLPLSGMYLFLPGSDRFRAEPAPEFSGSPVVALDCGDQTRLTYSGASRIALNIDHHSSNSAFAEVNCVDADASATGELVYDIILQLGARVTSEIALALYVAISTDTGFFRFSNTRSATLTLAGRLVELGVDPGRVAEIVHERKRFGTLKLLGYALDGLERSTDGKVAWMEVRHDHLMQYGADMEETEGFVNYTRQIDGVEIGILFKEGPAEDVRVSLRSDSHWDVSKLAAMFGGGGHPRAAGCTLKRPLAEAKPMFLEAVREWIASHPAPAHE